MANITVCDLCGCRIYPGNGTSREYAICKPSVSMQNVRALHPNDMTVPMDLCNTCYNSIAACIRNLTLGDVEDKEN